MSSAEGADRARELISFVSRDDSALEGRLSGLLSAHDYTGLVLGILERQNELFKGASEEDIEGVFTLILSLLDGLSPSDHDAVIDTLASGVTSTTADKPLMRLKV